jgi:hypothetical protein
MKRNVVLGFLSLALVGAACGSTTGGSSNALAHKTPKAVLASAVAAAKASGSFHYDLTAKISSSSQSIVGDASTTEGRQTISEGTLKIEAELIGKTVYIEGNVGGLEDQMGFSSSAASTYAGKWISIVPTDAPYASVTDAVTLPSALTELEPTGHLSLTPATTEAGQAAIGVRGALPTSTSSGVKGTIVLYVATAHPTVALAFNGQATSSGTKESDSGTFSNWGKPLDLTAPAGAVAFSSLPASATAPSS